MTQQIYHFKLEAVEGLWWRWSSWPTSRSEPAALIAPQLSASCVPHSSKLMISQCSHTILWSVVAAMLPSTLTPMSITSWQSRSVPSAAMEMSFDGDLGFDNWKECISSAAPHFQLKTPFEICEVWLIWEMWLGRENAAVEVSDDISSSTINRFCNVNNLCNDYTSFKFM